MSIESSSVTDLDSERLIREGGQAAEAYDANIVKKARTYIMPMARGLAAARLKYRADIAFGEWLRNSSYNKIGRDDRAALIWLAKNDAFAAQFCRTTHLVSPEKIWEAVKGLLGVAPHEEVSDGPTPPQEAPQEAPQALSLAHRQIDPAMVSYLANQMAAVTPADVATEPQTRNHWTPEEDARLRQLHGRDRKSYEACGEILSREFDTNRTARACRERFNRLPPESRAPPQARTPAPDRLGGPRPRYLSREEVDPGFTGTATDFVDLYGHVQTRTAVQFSTQRFGDWTTAMRDALKKVDEAEVRKIDPRCLTEPSPRDVARLAEALAKLESKVAEAKMYLATAQAALAQRN